MKQVIISAIMILGMCGSAWAEKTSSHMLHCAGNLLNGNTAKTSSYAFNIMVASDGSWLEAGDGLKYKRGINDSTSNWQFKSPNSKTLFGYVNFNPDFLSVTASMRGIHMVTASCIPTSNPFK
jgi:hypothetical protein